MQIHRKRRRNPVWHRSCSVLNALSAIHCYRATIDLHAVAEHALELFTSLHKQEIQCGDLRSDGETGPIWFRIHIAERWVPSAFPRRVADSSPGPPAAWETEELSWWRCPGAHACVENRKRELRREMSLNSSRVSNGAHPNLSGPCYWAPWKSPAKKKTWN